LTQRREPPGWEAVRRLNAEVGDVLETILDLLAPRTYSAVVYRAASYQDPPASVAALRAGSVMPGQTGEIRTGLRNDSGQPVDLSFVCSDLVGDAGQRIAADRIQLQPNRVRLEPDGLVRLTIALEVPANASPGLYRALLQASSLESLRALVTFPVG
jgi:hypothetical protein